MRFFFLTFLFLLLLGCSTVEFVRKDFSPIRQGVLRYVPTNSVEREVKYRGEITKEASGFCGGDFRITKEYQAREDTGTSTGLGSGVAIGSGGLAFGTTARNSAMYNFVEFICVK